MPARLARRAGGACFRPVLAPPVHSSWQREGEARQDSRWPQPWPGPAPSCRFLAAPPGNGAAAPPPGGAGRLSPYSGKLLWPVPDGTPGEPRGPRPPRRGRRRVLWPRLAARGSGPRVANPVSALVPGRPTAFRPPNPPPARTPARQRHPVASRNLTPSSASCAPPRPAANFLSPTSERAGRPDGWVEREGSPRRTAGPPQLLVGRPGGPARGARKADAPARARPGTRSSVPPEGPRPLPGGRAGAAGGGAAEETCHSRRGAARRDRPGAPTAQPARLHHSRLCRARPSFLPAAGDARGRARG